MSHVKSVLDARELATVDPMVSQTQARTCRPLGVSVATAGRWISDDEFLLDLDTVTNVNHFLFNVQFNENRVYIRMNETTGEMKNVLVEGMAKKP